MEDVTEKDPLEKLVEDLAEELTEDQVGPGEDHLMKKRVDMIYGTNAMSGYHIIIRRLAACSIIPSWCMAVRNTIQV